MLKAFTGALKSGAGFSFAHLIGGGSPKNAEAPTVEAVTEDEDEEDGVEAAAAAAAAAGKPSGKAKNKSKTEGEDDSEEASAGEEDGDEDDEDEEDEEDEEEEAAAETSEGDKGGKKKGAKPASKPAAKKANKGAYKSGRKAERRRVGLILSNPAAANNIGLALKLACNTGMSSSAAIALLEATPAARGGRLDQQMKGAGVPDVKAGGPEAPKGEQAIADSWDRSMKAFHPSK
jgi:hypothetical protein